MEDLTLKGLIVVATAFYVAWALPSWVKKFIPTNAGKRDIPKALRLVVIAILSMVFSTVLWAGISTHMAQGITTLRSVVGSEPMISMRGLFPEIILAIVTVLLVFWLLKVVFDHLNEPSDLAGAVISLVLVLGLFYMGEQIWVWVGKYLMNNLNGANMLYQSEPFQIIENFFNPPD